MIKRTYIYQVFPVLIIISFLALSIFPQQADEKDPFKAGTVQKNSLGIEFAYIPPGTFRMGSENGDSDETPVHEVKISQAYWIGIYEITQEQWKKVLGTTPSNFQNCEKCPVEQVSWNDVQKFIKALNSKEKDGWVYRLPTEAEWEYAARAGTTEEYAGDLESMGWYDANSGLKTHPVGTKSANPWGLYDMHGNVWEWVQDWYGNGKYPDESVTDPSGPTSGTFHVARGGGWDSNATDLRSANRFSDSPDSRFHDLGFRIVRSIN